MARKVRHSALESRSARLKLQVRRKPYPGPSLARGVSLLYRRNRTNGTWVGKESAVLGAYWPKRIGDPNVSDDAAAKAVLTFFRAQDRARSWGRGNNDSGNSPPISLDGAPTAY